jgi:hypothetical protein
MPEKITVARITRNGWRGKVLYEIEVVLRGAPPGFALQRSISLSRASRPGFALSPTSLPARPIGILI